MNRIYKVIWNKAKHCYVVVSELAKSRTKSPSVGRAVRGSLAAVLTAAVISGGMLVMPNAASAAENEANQIASIQVGEAENDMASIDIGGYTVVPAAVAPAAEVPYTGKSGISVAGNVISIKDNNNNGLTFDNSATLKVNTGSGLTIKEDKLVVKDGNGLNFDNAGNLQVNAGKGLSITNDIINVKTDKNIITDTSDNIALKDDVTGLTSVESDVFKVGAATYISASGLNANNKVISNVATGVKGTDAVNVNQLNAAKTTLTIGDASDPNDGSKNFVLTKDTSKGNNAYKLNLSNEIRIGKSEQKKADGTVTVAGQNAKFTMINSDGKYVDLQIDGSDKAIKTVDGKNVVRVKAVNNAGPNTLAVMSDGLKFIGDNYKQDNANTVVTKKLNETLSIKGGKADKDKDGKALLTQNNIGVVAEGNNLIVKLAKDVDLGTTGSLKIGSLKATADSLTIGGMKATSKLITLDNNRFAAGYQADDTDKDGKKNGYYVDGLSNTTWDGKTIDADRAATEGQLKKVADTISQSVTTTNNTPLYFKANSTPDTSKGLARKLGEAITIKGTGTRDSWEYSGQNIRTSFDNSGNLMIMMDKDLKERSLTLGEIGTNANGKPYIAKPGTLTIYGWSPAEKVDIKAGNQWKDYIDGDGKEQVTRLTYTDSKNKSHTFATMDDGLKFSGDTSDAADDVKSKLNSTVKITGGASMKSHKDDKGNVVYDELTDKNIGVVSDGKQLVVKLAEDVNLGSEGTLTLGANTTADGKTTKNRIYLNGNKGDITVGDISIYGGSPTSDKDTEAGTIRGLSNTAWTSDIAKWSKDKNTISARQAATQGQLSDVEQKIAVVYSNKNLGDDKNAKYSLRSTDSKAGATWQQIENNPNGSGFFWDNLGGKITTGISLGYNATVDNMQGNKAYSILFGNHDQGYTSGIAIGENSYALTDSVNVGIRNYKHEMGDVSLADDWKAYDNVKYNRTDNIGVGSTTLGSNSYSGGALATTVGTYNIMTNRYQYNETPYAAQNAGAISIGALNSIESYQTGDGSAADQYSGIGNSVVGLANKTNNSNGSLIFGAGNEITNSIGSIADPTGSRKGSVADAANSFRKGAAENAGGAVMAIGGGNKADYALYSQIMGVGNTLTGTKENAASFNLLDGYNNTVVNSQNTNVIGSDNTVTDSSSMTVIGDNHNVKGEHTIIIGSADKASEKAQYAKDAVMIGHNAEAGNTSVAIGVNANAAYGQNTAVGPYASVQEGVGNSTALGYGSQVGTRDIIAEDGKDGVISVGRSTGQSGEAGFTRRIINVKAGVKDTDAVNVSQLRGVEDIANKGWNLVVSDKDGNNWGSQNVKPGATLTVQSTDNNIQVAEKPAVDENGNMTVGVALSDHIVLGDETKQGNYVDLNGTDGTMTASKAFKVGETNVTDDGVDTKGMFYTENEKGMGVLDGATLTLDNGTATTDILAGKAVFNGGNGTSVTVDGKSGHVTGLTNKTLDAEGFATQGRAATEEQLKEVNDTIISKGFGIEAEIGGSVQKKLGETISVVGDKNVNTSVVGGKIQIALENRVVLGDESTDQKIILNGNEGRANIGGVVIGNQDGGNYITSLDNRTWDGKTYTKGRAATEDQLKLMQDALNEQDKGNVKYDKNKDGSINYDSVTFGGSEYKGILGGGTHVYNVAYASGQRGDEAVNVDYLNDKVTEIEMNTAASEKHIDTSKEYTVDSNGQVKLDEVNGHNKPTGNQVIINDVASKAQQDKNTAAIGKINDTIGASGEDGLKDDYKDTNYLKDSNTLVDADKALDAAIKNNSDRISNVEETAKKHTTVTNTDTNITIQEGTNDKGGVNYELGLNDDKITLGNDQQNVTIEGNKGNISATGTISGSTISGSTITAGKSSMTDAGISYDGNTYISADGLNANGKKVINVANGKVSADSRDAINGSQLYGVQQQVDNNSQNINELGRSLGNLDRDMRKGIAGAAALAAMNPLDYDPEDKWNFTAGFGHYKGESAAAIGTYYQADENTMFNIGATVGNDDPLINFGATFKFGPSSKNRHTTTTSRAAMAYKIKDLQEQNDTLMAQNAELTKRLDELASKVEMLLGDKDTDAAAAAESSEAAAEAQA